jgi:hypothetical protein
VPVSITPFLLTAQQIQSLKHQWTVGVDTGIQQARSGAVAAGQPNEPTVVYGILKSVIPRIQAELQRCYSPHNVTVRVAGVFCHQSPYVDFPPSLGLPGCELGDLLIVVRFRETWGEELRAMLLQFKVGGWPKSNSNDAQWVLYTRWPAFRWRSKPHLDRTPRPNGAQAGALHAVIWDSGHPSARPADLEAKGRRLATVLSGLTNLYGGRPIKPLYQARSEAGKGWSEVVWDLLEFTAKRLMTLNAAGVRRQQRGFDIEVMFEQMSTVPALLRELLASAGVGRDDIDSFLRDAAGGERPPIGEQAARPDDGAISTLIIELDAEGR